MTVPPEAEGERLDAWLAGALPGLTRSAVQRLAEAGHISVDGRPAKKNHRLAAGQRVDVALPGPSPAAALPQEIPLDILYEDDQLLVVNKPRGRVVHPAPGSPDGTLVNALLAYCGASLSGIGGVARPGIVHRLDKDTSGLLMVAKTDAAHAALSAQLKDRTLSRVYAAVVRGSVREDQGCIEAPLGRSPSNRKKMAVVAGGRPARTEYRVAARYNGYTYLLCKLHTGRTHQIRVHFAHIGHPVAGDPLYGGRGDKSGLSGQCLHAREITFIHPRGGLEMHLTCPLPSYFTDFLTRIEKL